MPVKPAKVTATCALVLSASLGSIIAASQLVRRVSRSPWPPENRACVPLCAGDELWPPALRCRDNRRSACGTGYPVPVEPAGQVTLSLLVTARALRFAWDRV